MLLIHLGTQREAAVLPNVTFEDESLLADIIFSPSSNSVFCAPFFPLSFMGERETCRVHFTSLSYNEEACEIL